MSAEERVAQAQERWASRVKQDQEKRQKELARRFGKVADEAGDWSRAWGGEDTSMGRWLRGIGQWATGRQDALANGRTYQQPQAPVTQRTETVTRHVLELGSDAQTARALLGNRDFRDQLIRLIREQTALERSRAHSY